MIKTGLYLDQSDTVYIQPLLRLLIFHPDIEIKWIAGPGINDETLPRLFERLLGDFKGYPATAPSFDDIDLYIGPAGSGIGRAMHTSESMKAIITGDHGAATFADAVTAVCEYNRKALVRGTRVAYVPDTVTMLGALALMPAARNLLLNTVVTGTMMLPSGGSAARIGTGRLPAEAFDTLRNEILMPLQASFSAPMTVYPIYTAEPTAAGALLTFDCRMPAAELETIYRDFYGDHRHMVIIPAPLSAEMVSGLNKTVLCVDNDGNGHASVALMFDPSMKAGAGNIVHTLNLMFGLHELTGFGA